MHVPGTLKETKRKLLHARDATRHPPEVLVAVRAWVDATAIEVQEVGGVTIVRRGRPIVPVRTAAAN